MTLFPSPTSSNLPVSRSIQLSKMGFDMGLESTRAMAHDIIYDGGHVEDGTKKTAPFGTWDSEITKDAVFSSSRVLISPRVDVRAF